MGGCQMFPLLKWFRVQIQVNLVNKRLVCFVWCDYPPGHPIHPNHLPSYSNNLIVPHPSFPPFARSLLPSLSEIRRRDSSRKKDGLIVVRKSEGFISDCYYWCRWWWWSSSSLCWGGGYEDNCRNCNNDMYCSIIFYCCKEKYFKVDIW